MYTKEEASAVRQKFWISFGKYMSPVLSSIDSKVNWINYRTGVKSISFKMDATVNGAFIAIEIINKNAGVREDYFNHFKPLQQDLEQIMEEKWNWELNSKNATGNEVARIYINLGSVNVHRESDWPAIISFLKKRIIGLDKFWNEYKDIFEAIDTGI